MSFILKTIDFTSRLRFQIALNQVIESGFRHPQKKGKKQKPFCQTAITVLVGHCFGVVTCKVIARFTFWSTTRLLISQSLLTPGTKPHYPPTKMYISSAIHHKIGSFITKRYRGQWLAPFFFPIQYGFEGNQMAVQGFVCLFADSQ